MRRKQRARSERGKHRRQRLEILRSWRRCGRLRKSWRKIRHRLRRLRRSWRSCRQRQTVRRSQPAADQMRGSSGTDARAVRSRRAENYRNFVPESSDILSPESSDILSHREQITRRRKQRRNAQERHRGAGTAQGEEIHEQRKNSEKRQIIARRRRQWKERQSQRRQELTKPKRK